MQSLSKQKYGLSPQKNTKGRRNNFYVRLPKRELRFIEAPVLVIYQFFLLSESLDLSLEDDELYGISSSLWKV